MKQAYSSFCFSIERSSNRGGTDTACLVSGSGMKLYCTVSDLIECPALMSVHYDTQIKLSDMAQLFVQCFSHLPFRKLMSSACSSALENIPVSENSTFVRVIAGKSLFVLISGIYPLLASYSSLI